MSDCTVAELVRATGYPKSLINKKIWLGELPVFGGRISGDVVDRILDERETYVSFQEFAKGHTSDRFNGFNSLDRRKLLDQLELNHFYGVVTISPDEVLMGTSEDVVFFKKEEIPYLNKCLEDYFDFFAMSEKEITEGLLAGADEKHRSTVKLLNEYLEEMMKERDTYPPSIVEFVRIMLTMPDVTSLKTTDVSRHLKRKMSGTCKEHVVRFLNRCKSKGPVYYGDVAIKRPPPNSIPAYSYETYIALIFCIFNSNYIAEHRMIEKALGNRLFAETWLYLALFVTCGWRAADICKGWKYPKLKDKKKGFLGINVDTLNEDLLYDRLPDSIYEDVGKYCLACVIVSGDLPDKNDRLDPSPLINVIVPEMLTFYGMLTLIGEVHMSRIGDGYMKTSRTGEYQSKETLRKFFGPEILIPLNGENICSRRLNKSFLQKIEQAARMNGNSGLMASMIASYARNHTSMETITHYLKDHQMTGEKVEMVLYFMMERGVFGFEYYQTLLLAYPEALKQLPMKKQNELIALLEKGKGPLEFELKQSDIVEKQYIQEQFMASNKQAVKQRMKEMLEISQSRGKAKDTGLYCLKRARGEACLHPEYDSCLANVCPHMVFTSLAVIPLLQVIKSYKDASKNDPKMKAVLEQVILPHYEEIIEALFKETNMGKIDRLALNKFRDEVLIDE